MASYLGLYGNIDDTLLEDLWTHLKSVTSISLKPIIYDLLTHILGKIEGSNMIKAISSFYEEVTIR